jgi:branched-chain amino acid transport system substrate-binding protein
MKRRYNNTILSVIFLFLYACIPVEKIPDVSVVKVDSENELLSKAERLFQQNSYSEALKLYDEYISRYPRGTSAPDVLMKEGIIYTSTGKHRIARNVYKYLITHYPDSPQATDARIEILGTFYNEGQYKEVVGQADEVVKYVKSDPQISRLYSLLGDAYLAVGSAVNAVYFYSKANERGGVPKLGLGNEGKLGLGNEGKLGLGNEGKLPERNTIEKKIKDTIGKLSSEDMKLLLDRVEDRQTRGELMYCLGNAWLKENRREDAFRILSEFIEKFPDHENVSQVKQNLSEFQKISEYNRYTLGCLLPLTGSYHIYGKNALRGIELALSEAMDSVQNPGQPAVNIIVKDSASDPNQAVRAIGELANEKVAAVIGPIITAEVAGKEAQQNGIPIVTLTQKEKITDIGDYVFRNFLTPKMQMEAIVSYAIKTLGMHSFAILYPNEKYGETFMRLFCEEVASLGGSITGAEYYNPNDTDFRGPLRKIANSPAFDALFIPDAPNKAGLIIPQLALYNLSGVQLFGTNLWHSDELDRMAHKLVQGAVFPDVFFAESSETGVQFFVRNFQKTFGEKPGFIEAVAYDTATMLFQMVRRPDIRDRSSLKNELMRMRDFRGVTGLTSFDTSGEAHKRLYLFRIRDRGFEELSY